MAHKFLRRQRSAVFIAIAGGLLFLMNHGLLKGFLFLRKLC